jgi:hypothetical protein
MFRKMVPIVSLALLLMAAACSKNEQPAVAGHDAAVPQPNPVEPVGAPTATTTASPSPAAPVAGVTFSVDPPQFRKCDASKGHIVANVKWDVTAAGVKYVNVLVSSGAKEPTLFMAGKASGERKTGDWVMDGTRFILQDAATKRELATVSVAGQDC